MRKLLITNYKLLIKTFALMFILPVAAFSAADYGTDSIFTIGSGSRALSMGGAFSALADDSSAVYWNPAGLENMKKMEVALLYYPLYEGTLYNSATFGWPILDFGSIGLGVYRIFTDGIESFSADDTAGGAITFEEFKATLTYARRLNDNFILGFSLNAISMNFNTAKPLGIGADAGIIYEPFPFLSFGAVIHNLMNPTLAFADGEEDLPRSYTLGAAIKLDFDRVRFNITSDASIGEESGLRIKAGFEAKVFEMLSLRAGYNDSEINFGGGVSLLGANIDYAYRLDQYMGGLHRFTLSYNFGLTLEEQKEEKQKALKEQVKKLIAEELRKKETAKAKEYFDGAFALYKQEKFEDALDLLDKAFEWNEDYKAAKQLKELIVKKLVGKYYDRGVAAYNDKNYVSALENFKNVSGIEADYRETKQYINKLDEKLKMSGQVKQAFSQGVEYYVNRRYENAAEMFVKALASDPNNEMIRQYLGKAKAQASKVSGGKKLSQEQAAEVKKLYFMGLKSYTAGDLKAALASWKQALEINPEDIKILKSIEKAQAEQAELTKRGIK